MQIKKFKRPTYQQVRDYMFLFIFKHKESYPELLKLDVSTLAHEFIDDYKSNDWEYFGIEKKLEKWECAARRLIIRQFPYIPLKVAFVGVLSYEEKEEENIRREEYEILNYRRHKDKEVLKEKIKDVFESTRLTYSEKLVYLMIKIERDLFNEKSNSKKISQILNIEHDIVKAGIKKLTEQGIFKASK